MDQWYDSKYAVLCVTDAFDFRKRNCGSHDFTWDGPMGGQHLEQAMGGSGALARAIFAFESINAFLLQSVKQEGKKQEESRENLEG